MEQGNQYYQKQQYDKAIQDYSKVLNEGYESSELYYNLGNAYFRKGNLGFAILNYEKALKLSPGDEDIQHNLALANSRTIDRINTLPDFFLFQWWESFLALFTFSGWVYLSYIFYILLTVLIISYFFTHHPDLQRISFFSGIGVLFLLLISISISIIKYNREFNIKNGVVVQQSATAKLSPDADSKDAFVIHEGLKVKVEDKVDNYYRITLNDGKQGWLPQSDLKMI
ncbi:MAG TPA: tetratricopeptide repeat protein [Ignavibacteriaceae bacterium]|nr:tetratricopeptide repeat protein [Ignavibacteriaceae bacterium]